MREVFPGLRLGSRFVEITRNAELRPDALAQGMGNGHAFLHGHTAYGYKRADIRRAHAGVFTPVLAHVNEFSGFLHQPKCGLTNDFGRPHERDDGSVGGFAWIDIQQTDPLYGFYNTGYRFNNGGIAPFGNVGHAFD